MWNAEWHGGIDPVCLGRRSTLARSIPHFAFRIPNWVRVGMVKRRQRRAQRETSAGGVVFRRGPEGEPRFLLIRDSYRNWGFPKGHLKAGEPPAEAARREVAEETGLSDLVLHGPIRVIDWYFRFRGKTIHKYCHFFLFESKQGDPVPQTEEGITDCAWYSPEDARRTISYDNARGVLEQATAMVQALAHVGDGGTAA
jgi:8-oxo-dGTP pyrophosphatase MutT (NUDIX family)